MRKTAKKMLAKEQIVKIHALLHAIGMTDRDYGLTLYNNFKVDSCKHLTHEEAGQLIDALEAEGIKQGKWKPYNRAYEDLGKRPGMATPAQLRMIEAAWKECFGIRADKKRKKALRTWLEKYHHVSDLRFLKAAKVSKVMFALRAIKAHKEGKGSVRKNKPISGKRGPAGRGKSIERKFNSVKHV